MESHGLTQLPYLFYKVLSCSFVCVHVRAHAHTHACVCADPSLAVHVTSPLLIIL